MNQCKETQTLNSLKMKNAALILLLAVSTCSFAQKPHGLMDKPEEVEKIEAMRIGFITEELSLSPDQAKLFWPVYEEFKQKHDAIRSEMLHGLKMKRSGDDLLTEDVSEKDLDKMMTQRFANEQKELDLKIEYHEKFKEVLDIEQVAALYKAEHDFRRQLFERMRKGQGDRSRGEGPKGERLMK